MIQAIKIPVVVDGSNKDNELSFDYDEVDEDVCVYLDGKFICRMNYSNNFKQAMKKMIEKW